MSNEKLIRAWKDARFRSTLGADAPASPAGERLVEIDDAELRAVWGGQDDLGTEAAAVDGGTDAEYAQPIRSEGYVCTVSGERTGTSCWA